MSRYFVQLSYKGTNYHGWQVQQNALTVQEVLDGALSRVLRQQIVTTGSGRTDTGVHALQQFAHFDVDGEFAEGKTLFGINALLPDDIAVQRFIKVQDEAHARFDAVSRSYQYHMHFAKDPFLHQRSWKTRRDFDLELMNLGADFIRKQTDFASFCKSHAGSKTTLCCLSEARWEETKKGVVFYISADRFLRNMVRAIVGTLLDLGRRKISLDDLQNILEKGNRAAAGESVPAEGLYLARVKYPYITTGEVPRYIQ